MAGSNVDAAHADSAALRELEERLLQAGVRKSADEVTALLADDFVEFGGSGRIFTKAAIIESLAHEEPAQRTMSEFRARRLADGIVLVTYRVDARRSPEFVRKCSLRSSIWKWIDGRWQMMFHQGTPMSAV